MWEIDRRKLNELCHYGVVGMKWGVRNGPPYPLKRNSGVAKTVKSDKIVKEAIASGEVSDKVNVGHQLKHCKGSLSGNRSYIDGNLATAQKLFDELSGTGIALLNRKDNKWNKKERVTAPRIVGTYVNTATGERTRTNRLMIVYSKDGWHMYPRR